MPPTINDLEMLARQAGEILRAGRGQALHVQHKGVIDLVTEVDHRSERFLIDGIRARYPEDEIVTEETGNLSGRSCCRWYIDPLDGTVNYAHGIPFYCVSIAYEEEKIVQLGVVYDPVHDELFSAERGEGAYVNGARLHVGSADLLDQSLLATGFPYDVRSNPENNLGHYARFALRSLGVRRLGSAALDLCYVAAGRFDGYWETGVQPWDVAAAGLIASEAGAVVTKITGAANYLALPCSILAANQAVHSQMLALLQQRPPVAGRLR
jgi:myo-inositol-1(or 4)-monophosphatase